MRAHIDQIWISPDYPARTLSQYRGLLPVTTPRFAKRRFLACGDGSSCDLVKLIGTILAEPFTIVGPGCVITIRSTSHLLSCTSTRTVFSLVATPSARNPPSVALVCNGGEKTWHWLFYLSVFYMYSCTWPAQYGLVPRSSSEARFTFDSCPNKHSRPVSLHVVYFYSRGTLT